MFVIIFLVNLPNVMDGSRFVFGPENSEWMNEWNAATDQIQPGRLSTKSEVVVEKNLLKGSNFYFTLQLEAC